ncbi:hypothetical protein KCV05_g207, partial [Aureobasidium melanogenum]
LKHTIGCDREYGDKQQAIITKRAAWDEDWHLEDLCESFSAPCTSVSVPPRFGFVSVCTSISQVRIRVRRLDACLHDLEVGLKTTQSLSRIWCDSLWTQDKPPDPQNMWPMDKPNWT